MQNIRPKNILVTGLSGYLGSYLQKELFKKNYKIFAIEKKLPQLKNNKIKFLIGDISKKKDITCYQRLLKSIDVVIHLAAYVPYNIDSDDLDKSIKVNIGGSLNLTRYLSKGVKFIFASTCEVYGKNKGIKIKESSKLNHQSFYGVSKLAAEKYLQILSDKKNINLIILRFASIYGPGEKISRAIPNFIKAALKNECIYIFGDGKEERSFIFAADAAQAIMRAVEYKKSGIFNIASEEKINILNLAKLIINLSRSNSKIVFKPRQKNKINIVLDIEQTKKELKFKPKTKLKTGLKKEIESFRAPKRGGNRKLIIIFDLDGTILDVSQRYYEIYKYILKKRNFQILSKKEYWNLKKKRISDDAIIKRTCPSSFIFSYKKERDKIIEDRQFLIFDKIISGARLTLKKLKEGHRLYLLTMRRNRKNLLWQVKRLNLAKYFNKIFLPQGRLIPPLEERRNFIKEIKKDELLNSPNFMIIGDTEIDILAGKKEGIITCGILSGLRNKEFISSLNPDYMFNNINTLLNFL